MNTYYNNIGRYPHDPVFSLGLKGQIPLAWYFWDETWSSALGPFETEDQCRRELKRYARWLDRPVPAVKLSTFLTRWWNRLIR